MRSSGPRLKLLLASAAIFQLAAGPSFAQGAPGDPFERFNRKMFGLQEVLDRRVFGPLARGYGHTPAPIRAGLRNFTRNLSEPVVFVNDMLQGRVGQAATTVGRFTINTVFGFVGFVDVAAHGNIPHHDNSFGTTLGRWGAGSGPYLFLPMIGPSTVRDAAGSAADITFNPMTWSQFDGKTALNVTTTVIGGLNTRVDAQQQLDTIRSTSTDPYATIRSYYLQNRQAEITGQEVNIESLPDIDVDGDTGGGALAPAAPGSVSPIPGAPPVSEPQPTAPVPPLSGAAGALPSPSAAPPAEPPAASEPAPEPAQEPPAPSATPAP